MENLIIPLIIFSFSMCITPGPNNMMLTASGANFGLKRTLPHIVGIEIGMLLMFFLAAFGLGFLFEAYPGFQKVIKIVSISYLFYLSIRIAMTQKKGGSNGESSSKPLKIYQAALFQLVNPKAIIMAVTAMSTFTLGGIEYNNSVLTVILVFGLICMPSVTVWACFGTVLGKILQSDRSFRIFNVVMGLLTAGSVIQMV